MGFYSYLKPPLKYFLKSARWILKTAWMADYGVEIYQSSSFCAPFLLKSIFAPAAGPARGGFRSYPAPGLGGPGRVQVSSLSFGIAPQHRNQTCLQPKYQSAYSLLVIGRYFCYTAFRVSNSGRFD